jgi:hypothetical protein
MTTIADFDISKHLKVEAYLPNIASNVFIIGISAIGSDDVLAPSGGFVVGVSLLGGSDVLGTSGQAGLVWQEISCSVNQAKISVGGEVESTLYFQPSPAELDLKLQSWELDPNTNKAFRPGTRIRIRLDDEIVDKTLFSGYIDQLNVTYVPDQPNQITLRAYDGFKRYVNSRIPLFDSDTDFPGYVTPYEQLELIAEVLGTAMNAASAATDGEIPSTILTDVIPNNLIYEAIQVGLGIFWIDQETQEFVFIPRPTAGVTPPTGTYTIGNNHEDEYHLCMSDLEVVSDQDTIFNSLKVALKSDPAEYVLIKDQDSIDLYGTFAQDVELNTTDSVELERWARAVFAQSPTKLVKSVETPAIDRTNTLTEAAFFDPGQLVGVELVTTDIDISDYYTVTRVSHSIDVDNWYTTLELWKEF